MEQILFLIFAFGGLFIAIFLLNKILPEPPNISSYMNWVSKERELDRLNGKEEHELYKPDIDFLKDLNKK